MNSRWSCIQQIVCNITFTDPLKIKPLISIFLVPWANLLGWLFTEPEFISLLFSHKDSPVTRGTGLLQMALIHASTLHYVNFPSDSSRGTCHILKEEFSLTTLLLPNGISALCGPLPDVRERCSFCLQHPPGSHIQAGVSCFSKINTCCTLHGGRSLDHWNHSLSRIESRFSHKKCCALSIV